MKKLLIVLLACLGLTACRNMSEEETTDYSIKPLTTYNGKQITRGKHTADFLNEISTVGTKYDYLAIELRFLQELDSKYDYIILDYDDKESTVINDSTYEINDKHEIANLELVCFSETYYNTSSCQNNLKKELAKEYYNGGCGNFESQLHPNSYYTPSNWREADYGRGVYILEDVEIVNFIAPVACGYISHPSDGYTPAYNETCWWYMFSILTYKKVYKLTYHLGEWHVLPETN